MPKEGSWKSKYDLLRRKVKVESKKVIKKEVVKEKDVVNGTLSNKKKFSCVDCNKSFKLKHHLKKHSEICKKIEETEVRPFSCDICDKKFKLKHHLNRHRAICKKGYRCRECQIFYKNINEYDEHRKIYHMKYLCEYCDYVGHWKNEKRHMKAKHKGMSPTSEKKTKEN